MEHLVKNKSTAAAPEHYITDYGYTKSAALATPEASPWLALGAVVGPILFTLAWFMLGFLSPGFTIFGTLIAPYSPISSPISCMRTRRSGKRFPTRACWSSARSAMKRRHALSSTFVSAICATFISSDASRAKNCRAIIALRRSFARPRPAARVSASCCSKPWRPDCRSLHRTLWVIAV
jgi:hypothetical protein